MRTERRKMIIASKGLPNDYERVDYIYTSSGYIETGIHPDVDIHIETEFLYGYINSTQYLLGAGMTSWKDCLFLYFDNENKVVFNNSKVLPEGTLKHREKYVLLIDKNEVTLIDSEGNIHKGKSSNYVKQKAVNTLILFNTKNSNGSVPGYFFSKSGITYSKIYLGEKLVRYFVACKRKSDGVIGMYDLVGRKFYTSPNGVAFLGGVKSAKLVTLFEPAMAERRAA